MDIQHRFIYTQSASTDLEFPNHRVEIELGEANLTAMFRNFQGYLVATGFVLPAGMEVGLLEIDTIKKRK